MLELNADDAALVSKLAAWVVNVAPSGPRPMSLDTAIALAGRVHNAIGGK